MEFLAIIILSIFIIATIIHPLVGLYGFFIVAYIRPQDFNSVLANTEPAKIILVITLVSFLFHKVIKRESFVYAKQNWAILGIFLFILISRIRAIDSSAWWNDVGDFLRVLFVFFISINLISTEKRLKSFFYFFITLNLIVTLRFYISYKSGTAMYWGSKPGDSSLGFLANADDLGIGLVVALPFLLIPIFYAKNIITKGLYSIGSMLIMLGVLATRSRGALLGVFVAFIASIFSQLKIRKLKVNRYAIGFAVVVLLFIGFNYKYNYAINEQYLSAKADDDKGKLGRNATWIAAKQMIRSNPITGVGRGNFVQYWQENYAPGIFGYQVAHNIIYEVAAEIGLVGLAFFLFFSLSGIFEIRKLTKLHRKELDQNKFIDMIFTIFLISLTGFYVNGMFITVAFYWHIYILVALFVCAKNIFIKEMVTNNA